jgi:hypothetical protein
MIPLYGGAGREHLRHPQLLQLGMSSFGIVPPTTRTTSSAASLLSSSAMPGSSVRCAATRTGRCRRPRPGDRRGARLSEAASPTERFPCRWRPDASRRGASPDVAVVVGGERHTVDPARDLPSASTELRERVLAPGRARVSSQAAVSSPSTKMPACPRERGAGCPFGAPHRAFHREGLPGPPAFRGRSKRSLERLGVRWDSPNERGTSGGSWPTWQRGASR